jgi:hypothetical protein
MKMLVFLAVLLAVVFLVVKKVRKSQAEADLARRKEIARRRKREKETVTPDMDMVWPVLIRPATGKGASGDEAEAEPSMTSIEYEPPEQAAS